ncbi:DUF397 domain-containing protein [Streptomyces olivoreticuli]|uniref:DUF397 domain-containing protein n=1 Tax=Streptomyces olivoreticuli TaxID=68246 RepID=UPI000E26EC8E|nr:DUF397 domain-containing protein [Streptomyces olivoreticuli]
MTINESAWFKSSYSDTEGAECVEIAASPHTVHIRDSKRKNGPRLDIPHTAWAHFITYCR